jgi:hypothetical protein
MFAAIYRWRLKPGEESAFQAGWARITELAKARCGSYGSSLFRASDGSWAAIALWPDREARTRCFAGASLDDAADALMRGAIDQTLADFELDSVAGELRWLASAITAHAEAP